MEISNDILTQALITVLKDNVSLSITSPEIVMSDKEVAEKLQIGLSALKWYIEEGLIIGIHLSTGWRFTATQFNEFLAKYSGMDLSSRRSCIEAKKKEVIMDD